MRHKFLTDPDSRISYRKEKGGLSVKPCRFPYIQFYTALFREFYCISQHIDQHLPQLKAVAHIIIIYIGADTALVIDSFLLTLPAEHGIQHLDQLGEGKLLIPDDHPARFDPGHIQDIIDQGQQVVCRFTDPREIPLRLFRRIRIVQRNTVETDDGVHRRPDLVAHI